MSAILYFFLKLSVINTVTTDSMEPAVADRCLLKELLNGSRSKFS